MCSPRRPSSKGPPFGRRTFIEAVESSATVGEISDAMRRVYGEYKESGWWPGLSL